MDANQDYKRRSEDLFQRWLNGEGVPAGFGFEKDAGHIPEPYLSFKGATLDGEGRKLVFVTTNPGGGMACQTQEAITRDIARPSYDQAQERLASMYSNPEFQRAKDQDGKRLFSLAAATRIEKMSQIAKALHDAGLIEGPGFIQCEILPFHSKKLPNKPSLAKRLRSPEKRLGDYLEALRAFLRNNHVIALDATKRFESSVFHEGWIGFKAELMDFDPTKTNEPFSLRSNRGRVSARFYGYKDEGRARGYCLMDGGNHFPKDVQAMVRVIQGMHP